MLVVNKDSLERYLSVREDSSHYEEVEAGNVERLVYTHTGVAKIRPIREDENGEEVYQLAENNLDAIQNKDVDHINTTHVLFEDYRGQESLVIFQPYAEEPPEDSEKWGDTISESSDKGLNLDPKLENFGIQTSREGEEIFYGYLDVSDEASVYTSETEIAEEFGITTEEELME